MREILIESANISIQVPISEIPIYFHKQREEIQYLHKKKKELEEEIQSLNKQKLEIEEKLNNSRKISNATEETLQDFMHVKKELEFHGISMQDLSKFVICVVGIKKLCNYNPFEVVEKFSNTREAEDELKYTQLRKNDLETQIKLLKKTELDYEDRLNLNFIKLKNLGELENIGFSIRDLKKLKSTLNELSMEHKLDFEQVKNQWFDNLDNYESKLSLGIENKHLLKQINYHKNIIQKQREIVCSQILIGPYMKKLLSFGITELDVLTIKSLVDILLMTKNVDINNQNELQTVTKDLSTYCNLRSAIKLMSEKLMEILYLILQNRFIFPPIQKNKTRSI